MGNALWKGPNFTPDTNTFNPNTKHVCFIWRSGVNAFRITYKLLTVFYAFCRKNNQSQFTRFWGKFWTEIFICVKKLTLCNSVSREVWNGAEFHYFLRELITLRSPSLPTYMHILDHFSSSWTVLNHHRPSWTILDHLGPPWTTLDYLGPSWTILDHLGPSWTILDHQDQQTCW